MFKPRFYPPAILALALLLVLGGASQAWAFAADDAFISFRYSANLVAGWGIVYNPGAPPVEGYTTILWVLLMAIPHLLHVDVVIFARLVGLLSTIGTGAALYGVVYRTLDTFETEHRHLASAIAVLAFAAFPSTTVHAVSGMETSFFMLLLAILLYCGVDYIENATVSKGVLIGVICLLTGLTRPEGNLFAVAMLGVIGLNVDRAGRRRLLPGVWTYAVAGALYFIWRWQFYGQLLPQPYYIKVVTGVFLPGRSEVAAFAYYLLAHMGLLMLLAVPGLRRISAMLLAPFGLVLLFFLVPAHEMGYEWRYLFPLLPAACVTVGYGAYALLTMLPAVSRINAPLLVGVMGFVVAAGMIVDVQISTSWASTYGENLSRAHIRLGKQLSLCRDDAQGAMLAVGDAGAVPYYSGWPTIDTFGLNDNHITRRPEQDAQYVMSSNPGAIVLLSSSEDSFRQMLPWEDALYQASLRAGFAVVERLEYIKDGEYLWVMARPGGAVERCLSQHVQ